MRLLQSKRWLIRGSIASATLVAALFAACANNGPARPTCAEVSDAGAGELGLDAYSDVTTDAQPSTAYGMEPDPGPQCVDCTQASNLEVMTIVDFEEGYGPAMFNYGEPGVPIQPQAADGVTSFPYWGLQAADLTTAPGGERCGSRFALHLEGGRFSSWGGGYVPLAFTLRGQYAEALCAAPRTPKQGTPPALSNQAGTPTATCSFYNPPAENAASQPGLDVSEFDGISFWARRGPSGQATLRVSIQDLNTSTEKALADERLAWRAERGMLDPGEEVPPLKCKRIEDCCRHCNPVRHDALIQDMAGAVMGLADDQVEEKRCWIETDTPPWKFEETTDGTIVAIDPVTGTQSPLSAKDAWDDWNRRYKLCCPETMEQDFVNGDPKYGGKQCNPYVFQFDYSSGFFCWEPGDDPLPETNQNRCGDGFQANVIVDTEWKLFTIPWSELRRFTPNKPGAVPADIWGVGFYFGAGYLDTYLDDVGFYRKRR